MSTLQRPLAVLALCVLVGCSGPTSDPSTSPAATPSQASSSAVETPTADESADSGTTSPSDSTSPSGDTSDQASGSATASASASSDPAEDAARYAAVVPSFRQYWAVVNETYAAGGAAEPTQGMLDTMTGQQLEYWTGAFGKFQEVGNRYQGENTVVYANPKVVSLKPDGGTAEVEFCVDMSKTVAFDASGAPLPKEGNFQKGTAGLQWVDGRWKVAGFVQGTGFVASC